MQEHGLQSKGEGADKLAAVLKLESELQSVREQAAEHEAELRQELQQARRDKQEAMAKLGGLDLQQMEARPSHTCMLVHAHSFSGVNKLDAHKGAMIACIYEPLCHSHK